jgi:hypothetical protein
MSTGVEAMKANAIKSAVGYTGNVLSVGFKTKAGL